MTKDKPIFLVGLGAQKAGTSWLHAFLARSPEAAVGFEKEYHVFDALNLPEEAHFLSRRDPSFFLSPRDFCRVLLRAPKFLNRESRRQRLQSNTEAYPEYFKCLMRRNPRSCIAWDLTPEYGALPSSVLKTIKCTMEEAGFDIRAVFIMRDPVERCLSASRMYLGRARKESIAREYASRKMEISLEAHAFTQHAFVRTRYDHTLARAEDVFEHQGIFVAFYEELFTESETRRLTDWLGIDPVWMDFEARVHASLPNGKSADIELRSRIAKHYRPVYEDMFRRFGEDRIRTLWPSSALLGV